MRPLVTKLCQVGPWSAYLMVRQQPKKTCRSHTFLQGYQEIVLFFDNDDAGREAVESASSILPAGRVKIARLDAYKDASDALQADDKDAIRRAIWDAKPYRPDGIVDGKNLMSLVTEPTKTCDHEYPFMGLNDKLHGIRYGELTTLTAGSGSGKTSLVRAIAADLAQKGETVGILELEATTNARHLGLCPQPLANPITLENMTRELESAFADTLAK